MTIRLKEFRQKYQISQTTAAISIGIDQRQWSRYEQGKNEFPIRYLYQLCIKWRISADWILEIQK